MVMFHRLMGRLAAASLCFVSGTTYAQDLHAITSALLDETSVTPISAFGESDITNGDVIRITDLSFAQGEPIVIELRTQRWKTLRLHLAPNTVRSTGYRLIEQLADGSYRDIDPGVEKTYSGTLEGTEGTIAAGSLLDEGFFGSVWLPDGTRIWIQPLSDIFPGIGNGLHVVYGGEDTRCHGVCDTEHAPGHQPVHHAAGGYSSRASCGGEHCVAQLACDADVEYYTARGSSTFATQDRIAAIINVMNHQYMRDVNITHLITATLVRTAEPDPYTATDRVPLINEVAEQWLDNHGSITRDLVQLFTGRNLDNNIIGRARDIGAVCSSNENSYSLVQSDFTSTFACQTDLSAHELGHLWGAVHCSCSDATMNASITCTNTFNTPSSNSVSDINNYAATIACLGIGASGPLNDLCTQAIAITGDGTYIGNTTGATTDGGQTGCGSAGAGLNDIWWKWTAPATGNVTFSTCGSQIDTILSVHTGCPGTLVNSVGCNDDVSTNCPGGSPLNRQSRLVISATIGTTYFIRVSGYTNSSGNVNLNVSSVGEPVNDECAQALPLPFTVSTGRLYGANISDDTSCDSGSTRDIWYTYTAPCAGTMKVATCGTRNFLGTDAGPDTVLALYDACNGNQLFCDDDSTCTLATGNVRDSELTRVLNRGDTVLIRVSSFANTVGSIGHGLVRITGSFVAANQPPELTLPISSSSIACGLTYMKFVTLENSSCVPGTTYSLTTAPSGASINSNGVISWNPTAKGVFSFTVRASNSFGSHSASWSVTVTDAVPVIGALNNGSTVCGSTFTSPAPTLVNSACANPVTWSLVNNLSGASINASTGIVTFAPSSTGNHNITIRATNSAGSDEETYVVSAQVAPPIISPIGDMVRNCPQQPFTGPTPTIANSACARTVTYSLISGAPGSTIDTVTGVVSANLLQSGTYEFVIRATGSAGSDDEAFLVEVVPVGPTIVNPSDVTLSCPTGYIGTSPVVSNSACTSALFWELTSGPLGMTINSSTGSVLWNNPSDGLHQVSVKGTNAQGHQTVTWMVNVTSTLPSIASNPTNQSVSEGASAVFSVVAIGTPAPSGYQWRKNSVPLTNGGNISGADTPTLTINPSSLSDEGSYDCVVTNSCGTRLTVRVSLGVTPICSVCPADYNQDGGVDGADVDAFFIDWVNAANCADANLDGGIDGADVDSFFVYWVAGGC